MNKYREPWPWEVPESMVIQATAPWPSKDDLSDMLCSLTEAIHKSGVADGSARGFFGGDWGYGANFENETFLMHRHCQRDSGHCLWCTGCTCPESNWVKNTKIRETCDYCTVSGEFAKFSPWVFDRDSGYYDPPNFWYKPLNVRVTWYKYIGRSMSGWHPNGANDVSVADIFAECVRSICPR